MYIYMNIRAARSDLQKASALLYGHNVADEMARKQRQRT